MKTPHMHPSRLSQVLRDRRPEFVDYLAHYYSSDPTIAFRGSAYDIAVDPSPNRVTSDDLYAVTRLSVRFTKDARRELIEGLTNSALTKQFENIDPLRELHSFDTNPLVRGSSAWNAWNVLTDKRTRSPRLGGIGEVKASKLLARKRPHLIPIFDQVVACVTGFTDSKGHWEWTFDALVANDLELVRELETLRRDVTIRTDRVSNISLLRVLDVAIWMDHQILHPTDRTRTLCPNPQPWGLS